MSTFRFTYKQWQGAKYPYVAKLIDANTVEEAQQKLIASEPVWTIRSISIQCGGITKSGDPCQRFTQNSFCCPEHNPHLESHLAMKLAGLL